MASTESLLYHLSFTGKLVTILPARITFAPFDGICSGDITVIEAKPNKIVPKLLPFIIQNDNLFDYAVEKSAGSLSPRVKWSHLQNYEFELPDLNKQRELAELLWAAEETKQLYKKLLLNTNKMIFAKFVELFGNIGEKKENWPYKPLSECCIINPPKTKEAAELECSFVAMPALGDNGEIDTSVIKTYSELCKGFTYFVVQCYRAFL